MEKAAKLGACAVVMSVSAAIAGPTRVTVQQLDKMITKGAKGPDDIQRALAKYKGQEFVVTGTVEESSAEMKTITLKGGGPSFVNCKFSTLPAVPKQGTKMTLRGLLGGYVMEVQLDGCTIADGK